MKNKSEYSCVLKQNKTQNTIRHAPLKISKHADDMLLPLSPTYVLKSGLRGSSIFSMFRQTVQHFSMFQTIKSMFVWFGHYKHDLNKTWTCWNMLEHAKKKRPKLNMQRKNLSFYFAFSFIVSSMFRHVDMFSKFRQFINKLTTGLKILNILNMPEHEKMFSGLEIKCLNILVF